MIDSSSILTYFILCQNLFFFVACVSSLVFLPELVIIQINEAHSVSSRGVYVCLCVLMLSYFLVWNFFSILLGRLFCCFRLMLSKCLLNGLFIFLVCVLYNGQMKYTWINKALTLLVMVAVHTMYGKLG